jgi:hypothetical protein
VLGYAERRRIVGLPQQKSLTKVIQKIWAKYAISKMKYGLNNITGDLNLHKIGADKVFLSFANEDLISENLKDTINSTESKIFINKGMSKKSENFKKHLIELKQENYNGKWYESGWLIDKNDKELVKKIKNPDFRYSDRIFYSKDNLPYSINDNTGMYYNVSWSGYLEDINPNIVLGGFRPSTFIQDEDSMPYRNIYEIFDHKNIQIGDMGNRWFHSGEGRLSQEKIGYNKIFFQSGLNYQDISKPEINIFVLTKNTTRNNRALGDFSIAPQTQLPSPRKFYHFPEKQNTIRNWIFFFSGDLNLQINNSIIKADEKTITFGNRYQYKNSNYTEQNINYKIIFSGIYPEFSYKTFSITNLSSGQATFYVGIPKLDNNVFEISPPPGIGKIIENYIWTNEGTTNISGEKIFGYEVSRNANINFEVKLKTENIKNFISSGFYSGNMFAYEITGKQLVGSGETNIVYNENEKNKIYKPLTKKRVIPFLIFVKNNSTKITTDDYFYKINNNKYNQYIENKKENILSISKSGFSNSDNSFGITFYSTGNNLKLQDVNNDLNKKINKLDEYSSTGAYKNMRNIYPIFSGEAYILAKSNAEWLNFSSNGNQNFKWISGYSGFFKDNRLNPITGALQTDLNIVFSPNKMLPNYENINGGNFLVSFTGNKALFNNKPNNIILEKNKEYRFLQKDSTNLYNFNIANESLDIKIYEPEYNKNKSFNYRLIVLKVPEQYKESQVYWSGSNNYDSGAFSVFNNATGNLPLNNFSLLKNNSGEYFIYGLEPYNVDLYKIFSEKNNITTQLFNTIDFNKYKKDLNFRFVKDTHEIDLFKDVKERADGLWELKTITNTGDITGLYKEQELIKLMNQSYATFGELNPIINVTENEKYHFIRPTETVFEATGIKTIFATGYINNSFVVSISGTGIFKNYSRKTHIDESGLLQNLFDESKVKYFEYISFETTSFTSGISYCYGLENTGKFIYKGPVIMSTKDISGLNNKNRLESLANDYSGVLPSPIFSGEINVKTSDINNEYKYIFMLSGNNMDYIKI